jgi:hypothetical protein
MAKHKINRLKARVSWLRKSLSEVLHKGQLIFDISPFGVISRKESNPVEYVISEV